MRSVQQDWARDKLQAERKADELSREIAALEVKRSDEAAALEA